MDSETIAKKEFELALKGLSEINSLAQSALDAEVINIRELKRLFACLQKCVKTVEKFRPTSKKEQSVDYHDALDIVQNARSFIAVISAQIEETTITDYNRV